MSEFISVVGLVVIGTSLVAFGFVWGCCVALFILSGPERGRVFQLELRQEDLEVKGPRLRILTGEDE
jgi:hypothetical protein